MATAGGTARGSSRCHCAQVQALVRRIGDLMVVLLTQVVGRAIGLIGRGIAQGMGRSLGRG